MKKYYKENVTAIVYNAPGFRVVRVLDAAGNDVFGCNTSAYGKRAADIAISEARRFRYI